MSHSNFSPNPNYEFVRPEVVELAVDELRVPEPLEVVVVHGVREQDFLARQVGSISLEPHVVTFDEKRSVFWHYDFFPGQAHLTVEGACAVRLTACIGEGLPRHSDTPFLIPRLEESMVEIVANEGDMILFHGSHTSREYYHPTYHRFESITSSRRSILKPFLASATVLDAYHEPASHAGR